jgi:hypothetical protein
MCRRTRPAARKTGSVSEVPLATIREGELAVEHLVFAHQREAAPRHTPAPPEPLRSATRCKPFTVQAETGSFEREGRPQGTAFHNAAA